MQRWEIVRVWRADLAQPHDKFCICIDWEKRWFLYSNSEPPHFRKAREIAVSVESFEVNCLTKRSFIDTTFVVDDLPEVELAKALADQARCHGSIPPFIRDRVQAAVRAHKVLTDEQRAAILS